MREDYTQWDHWSEPDEAPQEHDLKKRVLSLVIDRPDERKWGCAEATGYGSGVLGMAYEPAVKPIVVSGRHVWVPGTGFEGEIELAKNGGPASGSVTRIKSFGKECIASQHGRGMMVRVGESDWRRIGEVMPYKFTVDTAGHEGFDDFDLFNMHDIYSVGGHGDIWHYDGNHWRQIDFPNNGGLTAVCCAGDDYVYIAAGGGSIYRGRKNDWELVHRDNMVLPYKDIVWFEDKLWCTNDYGVWCLDEGRFAEADVSSEVKVCAGNLSVRDDVLLVGGYGGAAYNKAGDWQIIFHNNFNDD